MTEPTRFDAVLSFIGIGFVLCAAVVIFIALLVYTVVYYVTGESLL